MSTKLFRNLVGGLLVIATLIITAPRASAQSSSLGKAAGLAYEWLCSEGYRPEIDEDGDVAFKSEGRRYYVFNYSKDPNLLSVATLSYFDAEEIVDAWALMACNFVTGDIKLVKVSYDSDKKCVEYRVQQYIDSTPEISYLMERTLSCMVSARESFFEEYERIIDRLSE